MSRSVLTIVSLILLAGCSAPAGDDVRITDIHGLALDPDRPSRLYVATHHGLFVADNDTKWAAVTKDPFDMMGFTMHPRDGNIMYASGHPGRAGQGWAVGVVKSVDAGRTWTTLGLKNEVDFHAMTMEAGIESAPDTIYGFHGGKTHFSTDGGRTWQNRPVSFQVASMAVDPASGALLTATPQGLQQIGRHLEGEWKTIATGSAVAIAAGQGKLVAYMTRQGLARSMDAGRTWSPLNWTVPSEDYPWGIATGPSGSATTYVGTARGTIHKTVDGGASWTAVR